MKSGLDKLGLKPELLLDPDTTVANLLSIPELKDLLTKDLYISCPRCNANDKQEVKIDKESLWMQNEELRSELTALQSVADSVQSKNAELQVDTATLQSRITSLTAQHTALQLANSQLVAEKEEVELQISLSICY